jgi:hypothetical protein
MYLNELAVMAINRGSEAIVNDVLEPGALSTLIREFGGEPKATWSSGFDKDDLVRLKGGFIVQPMQTLIHIYLKN